MKKSIEISQDRDNAQKALTEAESFKEIKVFDSHFHIIDARFPLVPNNGYLPNEFTCQDYLHRLSSYDLLGGAIVSGSFQGFDQSYLTKALADLGPNFVGVTQLPVTVTDEELITLDRAGIRALRFNLRRGGSEKIQHLDRMAKRIHEVVNWPVELYVDSKNLEDIYTILTSLPAVSIDHLGLSREGLSTLIKLSEKGVHVKASGFGRGNINVRSALLNLYSANPQSLMFGTDLPSTRAARAYKDKDFYLVIETLGMQKASHVLYKNAAEFYRVNSII